MKTRSRECKCVENVNRELLKQQNELVLSHTISMGAPSRVMRTMCIIETQKLDGAPRRTKRVKLVPTFCPFCGKKTP